MKKKRLCNCFIRFSGNVSVVYFRKFTPLRRHFLTQFNHWNVTLDKINLNEIIRIDKNNFLTPLLQQVIMLELTFKK